MLGVVGQWLVRVINRLIERGRERKDGKGGDGKGGKGRKEAAET